MRRKEENEEKKIPQVQFFDSLERKQIKRARYLHHSQTAKPTTFATMANIHLLVFVLTTFWTTAATIKPDIGPSSMILLPGKKFGYFWQASLDSTLGQARSKETSSSTWKHHRENKYKSKRSVQRVTHKLVSVYPTWLVNPKTTLGFLNCKHNPDTKETTIHPRFFSKVVLLTFGPVQEVSKNTNKYKVKLPITGGLLAMQEETNSKILGNRKDYGCLLFQTHCCDSVRLMNDDGTNKKQTNTNSLTCNLQTDIAGNYCPRIAGPAPVSSLRKWMYLSSQSIVHAYVMFRFHNTWNKRINTVC